MGAGLSIRQRIFQVCGRLQMLKLELMRKDLIVIDDRGVNPAISDPAGLILLKIISNSKSLLLIRTSTAHYSMQRHFFYPSDRSSTPTIAIIQEKKS